MKKTLWTTLAIVLALFLATSLMAQETSTDWQIYLSPPLFELGVLPAVDVGKSVSRVGGKAHRADKNIDELLEDLNGTFHRLRQSGIDEELFDVISGFEALRVEEKRCVLA